MTDLGIVFSVNKWPLSSNLLEIRDSDWFSSRFLLAARQRSPFWIRVRGKVGMA